jgi:hypothetical protein
MRISGLTVCVAYSDLLAKGWQAWVDGLERILVVTSPKDEATINLCQCWGIEYYPTNAFYENGAVFNKGAAISEAVETSHWLDDWQLLFDADIIPHKGWRAIVETSGIQAGNLYGAKRRYEDGRDIWDGELAGFFQLFHASDPNVQQRKPLLDCGWTHAGGYDSEFQSRWPHSHRLYLPLTVTHQGEPRQNWWGRGNIDAMRSMDEERAKTRKLASCERMK